MKQNENLKAMGVVQVLAKKWADTDDTVKQKLMADYMKEKEEYTKKIAQYEAKLTDEQRATIRGARQELDESREKRALRKVSRASKSRNDAELILRNLFFLEKPREQQAKKASVGLPTFPDWIVRFVTARWHELSRLS